MSLQQILNTWRLMLVPLIAIAGPFDVGVSDVFHRWAQDEFVACVTALSSDGKALRAMRATGQD